MPTRNLTTTINPFDKIEKGRERFATADLAVRLIEDLRRDYWPDVNAWDAFAMTVFVRATLSINQSGRLASVDRISRMSGISRSTVQRRMEMLHQQGAVEKRGSRFALVPEFFNAPHILEGFKRRRQMVQAVSKKLAD